MRAFVVLAVLVGAGCSRGAVDPAVKKFCNTASSACSLVEQSQPDAAILKEVDAAEVLLSRVSVKDARFQCLQILGNLKSVAVEAVNKNAMRANDPELKSVEKRIADTVSEIRAAIAEIDPSQ